uniref:Progestin and adipoQ receptor family member 5 n=1 Tax=Malurus cyaneus samueli TaxID=2593467 RepID=A0A8C5X8R0_9PASS
NPRIPGLKGPENSYREPGILCGYRPPRSSARACLRSLFRMNNETLNVWTHLVPAGYFLWLFQGWLRVGWPDPGIWPFLAFLGTCCLYPLASSAAHAFSPVSDRARHLGYCCDYTALSLYSLGEPAFPGFMGFGEFGGVRVNRDSLQIPCVLPRFLEVERPQLSKASRISAFVYPYIFDSIPLFYRLWRCGAGGCSDGSIPLHLRHSLCALLTCAIFTSRLPERLAPGRFDYIGHSHQVFHVFGILGTHFQLEAVSMDMAERRGRLPLPSSLETFGSLGMAATASLAIIGICSLALPREKSH